MKIEELKQQESLWVAHPGRLHPEYAHEWIGFLKPTEMRILNCEEENIYNSHPYINEHYVLIQLEGYRGVHKFDIDMEDEVQFKFTPFIDVDKTSVEESLINEIKRMLKSSWNSTNGVKHRDILKKYIIENHLEYFSRDYPEIII